MFKNLFFIKIQHNNKYFFDKSNFLYVGNVVFLKRMIKMSLKYIILSLGFFFVVQTAIAQENEKDEKKEEIEEELIQLSGIVKDEFERPLQFVTIRILNRGQGTISDQRGIFSFISIPFDTIKFSCVGFKPALFVLPDSLPSPHLNIDVYLTRDTIMLEEAFIYPWKTYEEFKEAVLTLELPDDDYDRARRNIALIKTQILLADEPIPTQSFKYVMQENYERSMMKGMAYPVIKLFDPIAWSRFIKAVKNGDFKRDD